MDKIKEYWTKLPTWGKAILIIVSLGVIFLVIKSLSSKSSSSSSAGNPTSTDTGAGSYIVGNATTGNPTDGVALSGFVDNMQQFESSLTAQVKTNNDQQTKSIDTLKTDIQSQLNTIKNTKAATPTPAAVTPTNPAAPKSTGRAWNGQYISQGATGGSVSMIQQQLTNMGYSPQGVDGIFGNHTRSAVINFQRAKGISVDGIVGPQTWKYLFG